MEIPSIARTVDAVSSGDLVTSSGFIAGSEGERALESTVAIATNLTTAEKYAPIPLPPTITYFFEKRARNDSDGIDGDGSSSNDRLTGDRPEGQTIGADVGCGATDEAVYAAKAAIATVREPRTWTAPPLLLLYGCAHF